MKRRFNNDPSELLVKWACNCATCGAKLQKGARAYYWPSDKKMYCLTCGEPDFRRFLEEVADEEMLTFRY